MISHVRLFATPWTVACQAPLSMEFSRPECWVAIPFSRGISWIQGSKLGFLHCRQILYHPSHKGSPIYVSVYVCVYCMCECCMLSYVPHFVTHGPQGNSLWPTRPFCPWNFLSKNTGAGCHFPLQGSFPIQGLNLCLLHLQYWQVDSLPLVPYIYGLFWWLSKESACNAGDLGSIPRLGKSPGEGNNYPLQYSGLENSMDRGAWQATVHGIAKSRTRLSSFHIYL